MQRLKSFSRDETRVVKRSFPNHRHLEIQTPKHHDLLNMFSKFLLWPTQTMDSYLGVKDLNSKCYHACCCLRLFITSTSNYGQGIHTYIDKWKNIKSIHVALSLNNWIMNFTCTLLIHVTSSFFCCWCCWIQYKLMLFMLDS